MAVTPSPTGASSRAPGAGRGDPLDARLDLDDLERPLDLDVIGTDSPRQSERLSAWLEQRGVTPALRRHRPLVIGVGVLALAALVGGGVWWAGRPTPLPSRPLLLIKTIGADATQVTLETSPVSGRATGLAVQVAVASVERPGTRVELVSLTGPGLSGALGATPVAVDTSVTDAVVPVAAAISCATATATAEVLTASPDDYGVQVRRSAPEGETRTDRVPLVGAQHLHQLLGQLCLQEAAERDLSVASVTARPVAGVAAADAVVTLANSSAATWYGLESSSTDVPSLVATGPPASASPGGLAEVGIRLWPTDCLHPTTAIAAGLTLRGSPAATDVSLLPSEATTFQLPLGRGELATIVAALAAPCRADPPHASVTEVRVLADPSGESAGTLQLVIALSAAGSSYLEVDDVGDTQAGRLTALDSPAHLVAGRGVLHELWVLPSCAVLEASGPPQLSVHLADAHSGVWRPFLMAPAGKPLEKVLHGLCGATVVP
jgi:hypothetical protein